MSSQPAIRAHRHTLRDRFQDASRRPPHGFTVIELLAVLSIVAVLVGILLPVLSKVRRHTYKVTCSSNLKQIGYAIQMYRDTYATVFPVARYMPKPFLSGDDDPPLTKALESFIANNTGRDAQVYHCASDAVVFPLSGTSYMYQSELSGQRIEQFFPVAVFKVPISQIVVARDFDGGVFDLEDGSSVVAPSFHDLRNLLFADGRVGNFQ